MPDGEHARQLLDPIHDPVPTMVVVFAGVGIVAAQEGTPDAAVHHVIPRGVRKRNEGGARFGYGDTLAKEGQTKLLSFCSIEQALARLSGWVGEKQRNNG